MRLVPSCDPYVTIGHFLIVRSLARRESLANKAAAFCGKIIGRGPSLRGIEPVPGYGEVEFIQVGAGRHGVEHQLVKSVAVVGGQLLINGLGLFVRAL